MSYAVAVIRQAPHFSFPPENVEVMPGGAANLTCIAVGSPMPYVRWRRGSVELTPPESIGRSVLVLTDIQESATYTCVASNEMGRIENTTNVTVKGSVMFWCLPDSLLCSERFCTVFSVFLLLRRKCSSTFYTSKSWNWFACNVEQCCFRSPIVLSTQSEFKFTDFKSKSSSQSVLTPQILVRWAFTCIYCTV